MLRGGIPVMAVNVDEWKLRPLNLVFLGDERGLRLVFLNRWYSCLRGALRLEHMRQGCRNAGRRHVRPHKQKNYGRWNESKKCKSSPRFHHPPLVRNCQTIFPQDGATMLARLFLGANKLEWFCQVGFHRGDAYARASDAPPNTRGTQLSLKCSPRVSRPITPTTGTFTTVPPLVRTEAFELGLALLR